METPASPAPEKTPPSAAKPRRAAQRPPRREPHPLLHLLAELHPQLFGARFLPLKVGIFEDLVQRHGAALEPGALKAALGYHARSTRYLEAVAAGEARHDLDGRPVEPVAPEHRLHAILEVFKRRQAHSRQDLRPWLVDRLADAVAASGLDRAAYLERVRTQDPFALAALDEAFDRLGAQAAKREALRRAYEASGRTPEAFAEMYGLALAEVQAAIAAR